MRLRSQTFASIFWDSALKSQRESGLFVAAFCRGQGLGQGALCLAQAPFGYIAPANLGGIYTGIRVIYVID